MEDVRMQKVSHLYIKWHIMNLPKDTQSQNGT